MQRYGGRIVQPVGDVVQFPGPVPMAPTQQTVLPPLSLQAKSDLLRLADKHGISFPDLVGMVAQMRQEMGK